jgi:hypothetical protein
MTNSSAIKPTRSDMAAMEEFAKRFVRGYLDDTSVNMREPTRIGSETDEEFAKRCVHGCLDDSSLNMVEMIAPNFMAGHIYDDQTRPMDFKIFLGIRPTREARLKHAMPDYLQDPGQVFWGTEGFFYTQNFKGTLRDGTKINVPVGGIYTVKEVKDRLVTTQVLYYQDRQQLEPLMTVLNAIDAKEPWQKALGYPVDYTL